ncbi:MAG TPA: flagellin [Roseiarcus sp.]|nr:flagellin [Roseiarcus sp.]
MSSILNNPAALSALQALQMTQQSLGTVQNEVSTGLRVATAADNSSYWSIAAQLNADSGVVNASNDALSQGQSLLATASSAINSVITTINSIQTALTQATEPGAQLGNINTALASLGKQLTDAVSAASFNGLNVLNGSVASLNFVSGFNASSNGGTINTISFTTEALYGLATGGTSTSTTSQSTVTDAATMSQLQAQFAADTADTTAVTAGTVTATYGKDAIYEDTASQALTVQSMGLNGVATTTTYTALDSNGNSIAQGGTPTFATAASYAVTTTVTTPASQNLLVQGGLDLTNLNISGAPAAQSALNATNQALSAVTNYAALIGATQNRMTTANTFNTALMTNYSEGVAGMVDANMNTASTQLQALQTQEQLGIQSLSIANQNAQLILKLFQ